MKQCSEIETSSTLPSCNDVFEHSICDVAITNEAILKIIRALDPNKAHDWDGISVRMIRICDNKDRFCKTIASVAFIDT